MLVFRSPAVQSSPHPSHWERALAIIESSLARLLGLVTAAQNFDRSTADLIEAPRVPVGLALVVGEAALSRRYVRALALAGFIDVGVADGETAVARGLHRIWKAMP